MPLYQMNNSISWMKTNKPKYIEWLLTGTGFLALFLFFYLLLPYHLFHREQTQLFLFSTEMLVKYASHPAALACFIGDFLTQFFYYEGVGPALMAIILIFLGVVIYHLIAPYIARWAWLPTVVIVLWETGRQSGLAYPLSSSIALIGGGLIALCCRRYMQASWKLILPIGFMAIGASYYMFGYGVCLTALFLFHHRNIWVSILLVIEALALPSILRHTYLFTLKQAYSYPATSWYNFPDRDREHLLAIDTEMYFGRFDKVEAILARGNFHAPFATYYYNLLNARQGLLPHNLMAFYQPASFGLFLPVVPTSTYITIYAANELWFSLEDMTMAEHAAILGMIFSPNHTGVRAIKRLAEINLINGDRVAAMKYLRILGKTFCYRNWAAQRIPGNQTLKIKRWLEQKRSLLPATDTLRLSKDISLSLRQLLYANPENNMARDYLLCYDLLNKDISAFAKDYQKFAFIGMPDRIYAEALLIYLAGSKASSEDVKKWRIPAHILNEFREYTWLYERNSGNGASLKAKYGNTYWYYFHYATMTRNKKEKSSK